MQVRWMLFSSTVLIKKGSKRKALSTSFHHFQGWSSDLATAVIPFSRVCVYLYLCIYLAPVYVPCVAILGHF